MEHLGCLGRFQLHTQLAQCNCKLRIVDGSTAVHIVFLKCLLDVFRRLLQ